MPAACPNRGTFQPLRRQNSRKRRTGEYDSPVLVGQVGLPPAICRVAKMNPGDPTMKSKTLALVGLGVLLGSPALGQSLSERINYVMQQRSQAQSRNTSKGYMLSVLLYTDLTVQFAETPAREAFNYLQTILGINIIGRYSDDRIGFGIDPETPITLDVVDKPALLVLELVLDQCQDLDPCTWQLRNGFVEVGTKERLSLAGAQLIKYYSIRDLLFEPPYFDNAPELDLSSALNQGGGGGGRGGGGGGGGGFGGGGGGGYGGGGGGSGGGGGGGGSIFGDPDEERERKSEAEKADEIITLITEAVEPDAWDVKGGDWATIRYYTGTLIVRAPDFIHRQLGGYPFATRPVARGGAVPGDRRYLTFTGSISNVDVIGERKFRAIGAVGGGN